MRRFLTALLLCAAASCQTGAPRPAGETARLAAVDDAVRSAMTEHGIPGSAVVVIRNGKIVHLGGYGVAEVGTERKVDPRQTIFRIGSISKALTLLALSRLVDEGRVGLDDEVADHFEGVQNPRSLSEPLRIHHLMTHTTGLDQIGGGSRQIRSFELPLAERMRMRPALADWLRAGNLRLVTPPGLHYRYDTYGTSLAGAIIAKTIGTTYPEAMQRAMFRPLGMASTAVEVATSRRDRLAVGYEEEGGEMRAQPYEVYLSLPASSIDSTAADMGRLLLALCGDGSNPDGRLFSPAMAAAVRAPQFRPHPEFLGTTHGLHESIVTNTRGTLRVRSIDHGGTMAGFKSLMAVFPEIDTGVFTICNRSDGGSNPLAAAVVTAVLDGLPDEVQGGEPSTEVPQRDASRDLQEFCGAYFYGVFNHAMTATEAADGAWRRPAPREISQRDGALLLDGEEEYLPLGDDVFVRADGARKLFFGRGVGRAVRFFVFDSSPDTFELEDPAHPYVEIPSLAQHVLNVVQQDGVEAARQRFDEARREGTHYLREAEMNRAGYALLQTDVVDAAVALFRMNVEAFPESWNAHDSLGEALARSGENQAALKSYRRSLELNPASQTGREAVERLRKQLGDG